MLFRRLPRPDPEDCILDLVYDHVGVSKQNVCLANVLVAWLVIWSCVC